MPIETITYKGQIYPKLQAEGFASQYIYPFAKRLCKGKGYDIGFNNPEWGLPGAIPIDINDTALNGYDALKLPDRDVDYIHVSHCLEHLPNWVEALEYWRDTLRDGGILFLYMPHPSSLYWQPWNDRRHIHSIDPETIKACMNDIGFGPVFVTGADLNASYVAVGQKKSRAEMLR